MQVRLKLENIRADVEEFGGKAYRMGKANKDDAVVALLKDHLDEFKQVMLSMKDGQKPVASAVVHWASPVNLRSDWTMFPITVL